MRLRKQPYESSHSGQYCIAMITDQEPEIILSMVGKKARMDTNEVVTLLEEFGFKTSGKLELFSKFPKEGGILAILRVKLDSGANHWAVFDHFAVLDPLGMCCALEEYQNRIKGKITSFLTVWQES